MNRHILLCDDEPHIVRAAAVKIRRAGYEVTCCHDGEEAWQAILERAPDLVVTDLQMPRLDGFGLCQRIRDNAELQSLPVFLLTAKGFELTSDEVAQRYQVLRLIPKPFSPRFLLESINEVLAGSGHAAPTEAPEAQA